MGFKIGTRIQKWGKRKSVCLPDAWIEFYDLDVGDEIVAVGDGGFLILVPKDIEHRAIEAIKRLENDK